MREVQAYFQEKQQLVEKALDQCLPQASTEPAILHEAMRYSVFSGGKRLRPVMCLAAAEAAGGDNAAAVMPAAAVELLHTYTLVHDDLPAMDNDDMRRGQMTSHKIYGEGNAILVGDALLTKAFEVLAQATPSPPHTAAGLVIELARFTGSEGTVGGQVVDLASQHNDIGEKTLEYIHLHKTAALFEASVVIGAMCGGASKETIAVLRKYAQSFGLAFQIADDMRDAGRKDYEASAVSVYGGKEAKEKMRHASSLALEHVSYLPGNTQLLQDIVRMCMVSA